MEGWTAAFPPAASPRSSRDSFASFASYVHAADGGDEAAGLVGGSRRGSQPPDSHAPPHHHWGFDEYARDDPVFLIPLSATLLRDPKLDIRLGTPAKRSISLFTGVGLILGLAIGSGIFASPGPVLVRVGSGIAALAVWLLSGLLVLLGCGCYAELGSAFPGNGGEGLYLLHSFKLDQTSDSTDEANTAGSLLSFLFVWSNILVAKPCSVAVVASVFGEYLSRLVPGASAIPIFPRVLGATLIWVLTALNISSSRMGTLVQDLFTILKLISLVLISVWGFVYLFDHPEYHEAHNFSQAAWKRTSTNLGDYAIAFYSALWAYDGWSNLNLVTGELKDPAKNLPLAVFIGPSIVIVAYLLVNLSYYLILSSEIVAVTKSVALDFGNHVLGPTASAILIPLIVLGSTFGACNASIFTGSRITSSAATRQQIPAIFSDLHPDHQTPANALVLQATLASFFCIAATFEPLVTFYSNITWCFYFLAVFGGVILLRWTHPHIERPFKVPIWVAVSFCTAALLLVGFSIYERPVEGGFGVIFLAVGVAVWVVKEYYWDEFVQLFIRVAGYCGWEINYAGGAWNRLRGGENGSSPETGLRRLDLDEDSIDQDL
ncbi:amino acid permease-domain-containing protein [Obelidium mucronatum]|nr:amino acid permease-domain-containing protein [Obelidium mucronatum]